MNIIRTDEGLAWTSEAGSVYKYNFNGDLHSNNGPAIEHMDGSRFWYKWIGSSRRWSGNVAGRWNKTILAF